MRITKVYTKVGDKGKTQLVGGAEISKGAPRIEAYGTVDELNSVLGLARTFCGAAKEDHPAIEAIDDCLRLVQHDLFDVGAELATRPETFWEGMRRMTSEDVLRLEHAIDKFNDDLPPLKEFILPGGGPVGGFLHQARTVCRRAERVVVNLEPGDLLSESEVLRYLNRLSDLLFVAARWAAMTLGEEEYQWDRER